MTDATPAEIMRRLDEVVKTLSELARDMREERISNAALYLKRETFDGLRGWDQAIVAGVRKDVEEMQNEQTKAADFRKQMIFTLALFAMTTVVTLGVAVSNLMSRA